jgi:hypothetical protein
MFFQQLIQSSGVHASLGAELQALYRDLLRDHLE